MSVNALEARLLESKKDEIWQLMYIQRQSEGEAYATLVRKADLGWLGKQRFLDILRQWELEESEVWPARPEYWSIQAPTEGHVDGASQPCQDRAGLFIDVSKHTMRSLDQRQSDYRGRVLEDPYAHPYESLKDRESPAVGKPQQGFNATRNTNSVPKIDSKEEVYATPPLKAQNPSLLHPREERQESRAGAWLCSLALTSNGTVPNLLSQSMYITKYTPSLLERYENNDSLKSLFAHDVSSIYIRAWEYIGKLVADVREYGRGSAPDVQQAKKPVTQIFGYYAEEDEQSSVSDDDDEYLDD